MLTCSFGCRCWYSPRWWPISSSARLQITSLAFMLVEVPGSALDDVDHELVVQGTAADFGTGRDDGVTLAFG